MKMENLQNKNGVALMLVGFTTISTDSTQWKAGLAYMLVGLALTIVEAIFKPTNLPPLEVKAEPKKDDFKTN